MSSKKTTLGFTLIEIMLVMVVLGGILLYVISIVKSKTQEAEVEKTALGMQNWLQAASNYYTDKSQWPANFSDLYTRYFPEVAVCSPWFNPSSINSQNASGANGATGPSSPRRGPSTSGVDCLSRSKYTAVLPNNDPKGNFWGVQVDTASSQAAQLLAARLPSAVISNDTLVTAYTTVPVAANNANLGLLIKGIFRVTIGATQYDVANANYCEVKKGWLGLRKEKKFGRKNDQGKKGTQINLPTDCPEGWTSDFDIALDRIDNSQSIKFLNRIKSFRIWKDNSNKVFVKLEMAGNSQYTGDVLVITYCKPPNYLNSN